MTHFEKKGIHILSLFLQVAAGSTTMLAIMGKLDVVDSITGSLSLL